MTHALDTLPPLTVSATGEFVAAWRLSDTGTWRMHDLGTAPRATVHVDDIADLPRDPDRPDDLVVIGANRYLLGRLHPDRPFHRYLHKVS